MFPLQPPSSAPSSPSLSNSLFLSEFLGNSGHFLILKSLADLALYGWLNYFSDPTEYLLIVAMGVQTAYLAHPQASRLWGNMIGVSLYTLVDLPMDGWGFFHNLSHLVFWVFSLAIALLQTLPGRSFLPGPSATLSPWERWTIPLQSVVRMLMLMAFYGTVTTGQLGGDPLEFHWLKLFLTQDAHTYLGTSLMLVGVLLGFRQLQIVTQQRQLRQNSQLFQKLARWGMGSHVVNTAVSNPEQLAFQQCDRAVVFMDIRGFTLWCEQTSPQTVAHLLNAYYQQVEPIVSHYNPLRITFTADEIMVIYATPQQALAAAQGMQTVATALLAPHGLGAGCGIHYGTVVEGLFGGDDVRTYTVIGDVVNTAKRIEGATAAGEITISDVLYQQVAEQVQVKELRTLHLKGKAEPLKSWVIQFPAPEFSPTPAR